MAGALDLYVAAVLHDSVGVAAVLDRDHRVGVAPDDQGRYLVGEVEAVEGGDALALLVDHRAHRVDEGVAGPLLGERGVAACELGQVGAGLDADLCRDRANCIAGAHRPLAGDQRQNPLGARQGGGAEQRVDLPPEAAGGDQRHPVDVLGEEVGELHRDATAERMADDGSALEAEHGEQVADPGGVGAQRVVAARLG